MTIRKRNDEHGHRRGTGAYSDNSIKLAKPKMTVPVQSIEGKMSNGPSAALPSGGPSRHIVKTGPQTVGGNKTSA